ncbi:MAG: ImmA/IrrE family metallo-endopeptidase [Acholeplasma sp.]|jgi:Zn-dependent peptidase ImmA (M78 family)|nr:ImmA/IrrE family metallo-endopeptidase [Acholeplasma sp.]
METKKALSREKARLIAEVIRMSTNIQGLHFDVGRFLENICDKFHELDFEIVEDNELEKATFAKFIPNYENQTGKILIKNSVYESACGTGKASGRDRFTIVHEIAHFFLIMIFGYKPIEVYNSQSAKLPFDPEWQANALAGEILMPFKETMDFTDPQELAKACGVSVDAANYRVTRYKKDGMK